MADELRPPLHASSVVVLGVVRDCARALPRSVARLRAATAGFRARSFHLVESDSSDATVAVLEELRRSSADFAFQSLGRLTPALPLRTARIAACRNAYLDALRDEPRYRDADYALVADVDGVNDGLTAGALASCFRLAVPWDVCTANQRAPYYDVWALRHRDWCPDDCWAQQKRLAPLVGAEQALRLAVHARMVRLDERQPPIEVESAFGGLALYRRAALLAGRYVGTTEQGAEVCEHVALHAALRSRGLRIFINPALVNTGHTEHSAQRGVVRTLARRAAALVQAARGRR